MIDAYTLRAAIAAALVAAAPVAAQAASCAEMLRQGGRVIDSYVMDFDGADKLYVYILRLPGGGTGKCTSTRKLP